MRAASRQALEATQSDLDSQVAASTAGAQLAAQTGVELLEVVTILDQERTLRVSLADASTPLESRQDLARSVFGWKVSDSTVSVLLVAVAQTWSSARDLREALVTVGRRGLLRAAQEQGQLETVEDELFRLGRIVATNGELEQQLGDASVSAEARRSLLAQVLYGKVTAITEILASQAVSRQEGQLADDLDALASLAASLRGSKVATVTSATELSESQRSALAQKLQALYGGEVTIHEEVDPEIMGGMVIRVGDEVIDGSISGRIDSLRRSLP